MDISEVTYTKATVSIAGRCATYHCELQREPSPDNLKPVGIGMPTRGLSNAAKRGAADAIREKRSKGK